MRLNRGDLNTHKPPPIPGRILWPALGFPAVIAPKNSVTAAADASGDSTRCIRVLLLTDRQWLTKKEAADYLRYVPWTARHSKYLEASGDNSFTEEDLDVRHNASSDRDNPHPLEMPGRQDGYVTHLRFGGDNDGNHGITAGVARYVLDFYAHSSRKLLFLVEIRVSESASARLAPGTYHLFWNNANKDDTERNISDELQLLLSEFATPRAKQIVRYLTDSGAVNPPTPKDLLEDYEYEYGRNAPYNTGRVRAEILHPLFVRSASDTLKIAHVTDVHVDIRSDVYEMNLSDAGVQGDFSNWNKNFVAGYRNARNGSDILLLTGDLIDYGRGNLGLSFPLGKDSSYAVDRNWFLFYYLLASADAYQTPVYTILGNHDWRINPYPPLAVAGAPAIGSLLNDYLRLKAPTKSLDEWKKIVTQFFAKAHGAGYDKQFSYQKEAAGIFDLLLEDPIISLWNLVRLFGQAQTMNQKGLPTETTVESVAWYLMLINPFFDYASSLPGGFDVLMLDWAEKESVLFPLVVDGGKWAFFPWDAAAASNGGPRARNCLTDLQMTLVRDLIEAPGKAKTIGIHAPPVGPYSAWSDDMLLVGMLDITAFERSGRKLPEPDHHWEGEKPLPLDLDLGGKAHLRIHRPDGTWEDYYGHPFFAVQPPNGSDGQTADYGSIERHRSEFIREVRAADSGVRLVLSGHIHRDGLFVTYIDPGDPSTSYGGGQLRIRRLGSNFINAAKPPAVSLAPEAKFGPLYVNTVCCGPRGNSNPLFPSELSFRLITPGFAKVQLKNDGTVISVNYFTKDGTPRPESGAPDPNGINNPPP